MDTLSSLCRSNHHSWCANRNFDEVSCTCPCHLKTISKPLWHDTSIIWEKSPTPDSIKENLRVGAIQTGDAITISIRWNQWCHDEYKTYSQTAIEKLPLKQAKELAEAILAAIKASES